MAASLLPPSTYLSSPTDFCRMNPVYLNTHLDQFQRSLMSFVVLLPCQKWNIKSYMTFTGATSGRCFKRPFPIAGAIEADRKSQADVFNSTVLGASNIESMNDLERQLDGLFQEVKTLMRLGKENDAIDLLQANFEAVKEQIDAGARGIEEAAILDVIALGYMAVGNTKVVGSLLDMLCCVVKGLNNKEPLLDSILTHMGNMYEKLEKFEMAINLYKRAINITESRYGDSSRLLVTPLLGMAKVLGSIRKATEAIETYRRVITILELSSGPDSKELELPLFLLGNLLLKEGRISEAEDIFNRVLKMYTRLYGEKDGRVGIAMCSLAQVKCAEGNANEAIAQYKNALRIFKDSNFIALDDELMEKIRTELAELLHAVGRAEEGRALIEELITESYEGKDHPRCVIHLMNLATSYSRSKNFAEAERLLRKSLLIMMKTVPPDDQSVTFPMLHLAVTLYNLNRDEEAEKLALEVLHIREKAFGKESPLVGEALDCLVSIQTRLGTGDKEILELLERILKIQEVAFGHDSMEVVETLKKIVHCLDKLGMRIEKLPLQRRLSILRNKYKQAVKY